MTSNADILILASKDSVLPTPDWSVAAFPALQTDLARVIPLFPEQLAAMRAAGRSVLHPLLSRGVVPNSDFVPVLDLGTERTRFQHLYATGLRELSETRFDIPGAMDRRGHGFSTATVSPAPEIKRVNGLAEGAALRAALRIDPLGRTVPPDMAAPADLDRYRVFTNNLRNDSIPSNWHAWADELVTIEGLLDGGTADVIDSAFYATVSSYVARRHPPPAVVAAVDFTHGMATWHFDEVNRASGVLVTSYAIGDHWLALEDLRDGAELGHLMVGDTTAARAVYKALTPLRTDPPTMHDWIMAALAGIQPSR
jgi:hypothetical protein